MKTGEWYRARYRGRIKMRALFCLIIITVVINVATAAAGPGCGTDMKTGDERQPGDRWMEACNRCRCLPSQVPACTRRLCQEAMPLVPDLDVDVVVRTRRQEISASQETGGWR